MARYTMEEVEEISGYVSSISKIIEDKISQNLKSVTSSYKIINENLMVSFPEEESVQELDKKIQKLHTRTVTILEDLNKEIKKKIWKAEKIKWV